MTHRCPLLHYRARSHYRAIPTSLLILLLTALLVSPLNAAAAAPTAAPSYTIDFNTWVPDGPVYAIQSDPSSGRTYLGGDFDSFNPYTGHLLAAGKNTPPNPTPGGFPTIDGPVYAIAGDATNGWYVGGDFQSAGGQPRKNLLRLRPDWSLDPDWKPAVDGPVYKIALYGMFVYIGGNFKHVGGQPRANLAALYKTGALLDWWMPNPDGPVRALLVVEMQPALWVGGGFHHLGGQAVNALGAVDLTAAGKLLNGPPAPGMNAQSEVDALALLPTLSPFVRDWSILAGGRFTIPLDGGGQINHLARYFGGGELDQGLDFKVDGPVYALQARQETVHLGGEQVVIYAGGSFTRIAGQAAGGLARLASKDYIAFAPDPAYDFQLDGPVFAITQGSGEQLIGGGFRQVRGKDQPGLFRAAYNGVTSSYDVLDWSPRIQFRQNTVRAALYTVDRVLAGGDFFSAGGQRRTNLAALDPNGKAVSGWAVATDGPVYALELSEGKLFFGGQFNQIQSRGIKKPCANAGSSTADGALFAWCPRPDGPVNALAAYAQPTGGSLIVLGGNFRQVSDPVVGPLIRPHLALIQAAGGNVLPFNPAPDQSIRALAVQGDVLFAGGSFTQIAGKPLRYAAGLDLTGAREPYALAPAGPVSALTVSGPRIYLAEDPLPPGADPFQGRLEVFNWPSPGPALAGYAGLRGWLRTVASDQLWVYTGGAAPTAGAPYLAALDPKAAPAVLPTLLPVRGAAVSSVRAIHVTGGRLMVGGSFGGADGKEHPNYVVISPTVVQPQLKYYIPFARK